MTKTYIVIVVVLLSTTLKAQTDFASTNSFEKLDSLINEEMTNRKVPGLTIAIIDSGQLKYQKNIGYSDLANKIVITNQTGFNIGSISKTITAWGAMKLVELGKLELDSPVNKYLTRWSFPKSKFEDDSITIRMLLSHSAGLSVHGYNGWKTQSNLPSIEESLDGKSRIFTKVKVIKKPGKEFRYSGGGFTILQLIIEEVTGDSFAHFMDTTIVKPLGMSNSSFIIDETTLKQSSLEYNKRGKQIPFEYFTEQAAAGFQTTIEDFVIFLEANILIFNQDQREQSILSTESIKEMMSSTKGTQEKYGLGYRLFNGKSNVVRGHGGGNAGWSSIFMVVPEQMDGFVVLSNSPEGKQVGLKVFYQFLKY